MQHTATPATDMGVTAAKEFREEIHNIKYQYHRLAMQYGSLPYKFRRSVTRKYSEQRFHCAAVLEFQSNASELNKDNWQTMGKGTIAVYELPVDEVCPVARKWFTSLFEAEHLLEIFVQVGHPVDQIERIRALLKHARRSLQSIHESLRTILLVEGETDNTSMQAVIESWNIMATDVRDANLKPAMAAENAAVYLSSRPDMPMERFNVPTMKTRHWFECDMELSG